jgi:molybdopterin-containing oxidoreductase family molybdopterin binding subunit
MDLAARNDKVFNIGINAATAAARGIAAGDVIELESPEGKRITGRARPTEGLHPDCLSVPGVLGRWVAGDKRSIGKGAHFNSLLTYSLDHMDTLSAALDACVKVRVRRVA